MHVPSKIVCVNHLRFSKEMEILITTVFWCIKNISGSLFLFYNPVGLKLPPMEYLLLQI